MGDLIPTPDGPGALRWSSHLAHASLGFGLLSAGAVPGGMLVLPVAIGLRWLSAGQVDRLYPTLIFASLPLGLIAVLLGVVAGRLAKRAQGPSPRRAPSGDLDPQPAQLAHRAKLGTLAGGIGVGLFFFVVFFGGDIRALFNPDAGLHGTRPFYTIRLLAEAGFSLAGSLVSSNWAGRHRHGAFGRS